MTVYRHPERNSTFDPLQSKLLISAQGNLFTVQALSSVRRSTKHSISDDVHKWENAQLVARLAITKFCEEMNTCSPALPFEMATKRLVDHIAGQIVAKKPERGRGAITEFSRKSRGRLLRVGARLKSNAVGVMLTFTYRENMRDHALAKNHLQLVGKWILYHYPLASLLWRLEYQERGAIHFHILAMNINWVDAVKLTSYWKALTSDDSYPDVKRVRSRRRVMAYISKYIAKMEQSQGKDTASNGFIYVPYLENFVGRFWGIINRKALPLAPLHVMLVRGDKLLLINLRRYARRKWRGIRGKIAGFSLFVNNSSAWMRLAEYELFRSTT